ncbi:DUF488 domain-containing protein [Paracoccus luteus]|uniref:DUF488 domain-containing protein n=1 Tax=Paracoccus luteus TaxID=2508543 RepID=UPI00106F35C2|nr:DUF488 domain-containing protein [Paracoccus luteus]
MHRIGVKRAYEPASDDDGRRVLVDRVWPRGVTREALRIDAWLKDLAPSTALRRWFGHDPAKWDQFRRRYAAELDADGAPVAELRRLWRAGPVTLVYGARDEAHNNAVALRDWLRG